MKYDKWHVLWCKLTLDPQTGKVVITTVVFMHQALKLPWTGKVTFHLPIMLFICAPERDGSQPYQLLTFATSMVVISIVLQ